MKSHTRRLFSLLLSLLMVFSLAPTGFLADDPPSGDRDPSTETPGAQDPGTETPNPSVITKFSFVEDFNSQMETVEKDKSYTLTLEPDDVNMGSIMLSTLVEPDNSDTRKAHIVWKSSDSAVVRADEGYEDGQYGQGHTATLVGLEPGEATVTVAPEKTTGLEITISTQVSGIKLSDELTKGLTLQENETRTLVQGKDYWLYGNANADTATLAGEEVNGKPFITISEPGGKGQFTIEGRQEGTGMVRLRLTSGGRVYEKEFSVAVTSTMQTIEWTKGCSPAEPLKFSALEDLIAQKCKEATGGNLASVIGLTVSTDQGTLYLNYNSPEDTGAGVGGSVTYYVRSAARGPYISDITFVPKSSYKGEKAEIYFTGNADNGRSFKGKIVVTLTDTKSELEVTTKRETPVKLDGTAFSKICQEQTGAPLDYVMFTLPPASQGAMYRDYKDEWNYASRVSATDKYSKDDINKITFVPAKGFVGEIRVGYAGYSVTGNKYNGELVIKVRQGLDDAVSYNDDGNGVIHFRRSDFDAFCENATGRTISEISFTTPPASQGTLYLNWNGISGAQVLDDRTYSPAQIDGITFIAKDGFEGVVRIPFSGVSRSGEAFKGTAELHIQSTGTGRGDINYVCAQGQSVKFNVADFADLCQSLTGKKLHYITFQELPDFNQGALYHNKTSSGGMGTRATTMKKYFNSAAPYIMNLSFWATDTFSYVEIPFTGASVSGETFTGILAISSGTGAGSGTAGSVNYSVIGQNPVKFSGTDFDNACRQATNNALAYLRFDLPGSGQGILYYDYREGSAPRALDPTTTLFRSGEVSVDKVTFMPAKGFTGTAAIPFTGYAIDGREFQGTVQVTVQPANALGGLVRYETKGEPVRFRAEDIQAAAGAVPATLRLTALPAENQGKVYYQYSGPTQYSWEGNTSTAYTMNGDPSVSNLTFVPKAGYYGTVDIPYIASNSNNTQSGGTIRITVSEPNSSSSFTDLEGYSAQTKSAVEYLSAMGVVVGVGDGKFDPGASIKRRDFCVMLSRAFEFNVGSTVQGFKDVPAGSYYAPAVNQMYALGVVNGIGSGMFDPRSPVTRQDASLMVQRALNIAGISVPDGNGSSLAGYSDRGRVSGYAQGALGGMVQMGLFPVTASGTLAPRDSLTRADMALLLHRAMTQ